MVKPEKRYSEMIRKRDIPSGECPAFLYTPGKRGMRRHLNEKEIK